MIGGAGAQAVKAQDKLAALGLDRPPRRPRTASYGGEGADRSAKLVGRVSQLRVVGRPGAGQTNSTLLLTAVTKTSSLLTRSN
jgi:hypothetical protein